MSTLELRDIEPLAERREPEAIIKAARRRQRRRRVFGTVAIAVAVGTALALLTVAREAPKPRSPTVRHSARPKTPALSGIDAEVLMWPTDGDTAFGPGGGPPAFVDDLQTGRLSEVSLGISAGDYQPLLVSTGGSIVYVGDGTSALPADLKGPARVVGQTPFFAPATDPGRVWLVYFVKPGKTEIRQVSVSGGPQGQPVTLPPGSQLVEGTDAGLLLDDEAGYLDLWRPGSSPELLPYSAESADGIAATPSTVAYGSDCLEQTTSPTLTAGPDAGYAACRTLRILNVLTGRVLSVPTPKDTLGWVPRGFGLTEAISPGSTLLAAEAATYPAGQGQVNVYTISLVDHGTPSVEEVPSSSAFLYAGTAWSPDGSWLFFQGPNATLWGYEVAKGIEKRSASPCCRYTVMVAVPSSR